MHVGKQRRPPPIESGRWVSARHFVESGHGGVALTAALCLPPILFLALGAIQLQAVFNDRSKAQDIADAAALWGAQQLTVAPVGAEDRTVAFADAQLEKMRKNATVTVGAAVVSKGTMKVTVDTHRPSFFFNLMPAGGFSTHAEATAEGVLQTPLCVMTFGGADGTLKVGDSSKLKAPKCFVHSNGDIDVGGSALLQAELIETNAKASGPMDPAANTGAPAMPDPFSGLDIDAPSLPLLRLSCISLLPKVTILLNTTLPAGNHCSEIEVLDGVTLRLAAGEHFFPKGLKLGKNAKLFGKDVAVVFGKDAEADLKDAADISLEGREQGRLAGFVIVTMRDRDKELRLDSDPITKLTGTIYLPNAKLRIQGKGVAAQASDWTVMAAQSVELSDGPQIHINSNYSGSPVPVPAGVGDKTTAAFTRLTR